MYSKEQIKEKILSDQRWLERSVVAIYRLQTVSEQNHDSTELKNGVGFSGAHAHVCSYMAKWILKGNHLSGKYLDKAKKIMPHYTKQLERIANKGRK